MQIKGMNIHTVGDLFKLFLRSLPSPIIPKKFYSYYLSVGSVEMEEEMMFDYLTSLLQHLPEENFHLLEYLCYFFHEFTSHSDINKMGASNLSIIFSPSFFGQSEMVNYNNNNHNVDSKQILFETQILSKISQLFILHPSLFFSGEREKAKLYEVKESYNEGVSLIKGEEIIVFKVDENISHAIINQSTYHPLPSFLLSSLCSPIPFHSSSPSSSSLSSSSTGIGSTSFSSSPHPKVIEISNNNHNNHQQDHHHHQQHDQHFTSIKTAITSTKKPKRSHKRNKSEDFQRTMIKFDKDFFHSSQPPSHSAFTDDVIAPKPVDKKDKKMKKLAEEATKMTKKKEKKEEEIKDMKAKKINDTVNAWYGSTSSTGSFSPSPSSKSSNLLSSFPTSLLPKIRKTKSQCKDGSAFDKPSSISPLSKDDKPPSISLSNDKPSSIPSTPLSKEGAVVDPIISPSEPPSDLSKNPLPPPHSLLSCDDFLHSDDHL